MRRRMRPSPLGRKAILFLAALVLLPSIGSAATVGTTEPVVIPLGQPRPDWVTDELVAKAVAASARGAGYDPELDEEVPLATNYAFIRPGSWMMAPAWCTMNFIYGSPGAYSIGTAGHCTSAGDPVVIVVAYPFRPTLMLHIGNTATSVNGGVGNDYALVPILPTMQPFVDANVADIGGPQNGVYTGTPTRLVAKHFGHGLAVGTGGTPRAGVITSATNSAFFMDGAAAPGDSGSPVLGVTLDSPLGQGVGILTHLVVFGPGLTTVAGTRLGVVPATMVNGDIVPTAPA